MHQVDEAVGGSTGQLQSMLPADGFLIIAGSAMLTGCGTAVSLSLLFE
jgi:hypothetical protein